METRTGARTGASPTWWGTITVNTTSPPHPCCWARQHYTDDQRPRPEESKRNRYGMTALVRGVRQWDVSPLATAESFHDGLGRGDSDDDGATRRDRLEDPGAPDLNGGDSDDAGATRRGGLEDPGATDLDGGTATPAERHDGTDWRTLALRTWTGETATTAARHDGADWKTLACVVH